MVTFSQVCTFAMVGVSFSFLVVVMVMVVVWGDNFVSFSPFDGRSGNGGRLFHALLWTAWVPFWTPFCGMGVALGYVCATWVEMVVVDAHVCPAFKKDTSTLW